MTSGLTSEAAKALFDASYAVPASAVLANPSKYTSSDHIYTELGKLWAQTLRGLESLPPAQAHEPVDGRTLDEDLEDCVYTANTAIWAAADPKPKINSTLVYNRPSSIRKKMNAAAQAHEAQRAADRAAAEAHAHPPSIPLTPAKAEPAGATHAPGGGGLVAAIMANIKGSENELPADGSGQQQQSGNGSGGVQQSRVSPSLQNAAARLTTVGVTPLRKAAIGSMLATGFLQEHDTLTQWVRAQGLTGHSKREALTEARALELGVADYGVEFLTRPSAEVLLRRILALAIHSGTGSWQIAEKIEELPTESPFSVVPESLLKEIMEQVKNELKVAALAKQAASVRRRLPVCAPRFWSASGTFSRCRISLYHPRTRKAAGV